MSGSNSGSGDKPVVRGPIADNPKCWGGKRLSELVWDTETQDWRTVECPEKKD